MVPSLAGLLALKRILTFGAAVLLAPARSRSRCYVGTAAVGPTEKTEALDDLVVFLAGAEATSRQSASHVWGRF